MKTFIVVLTLSAIVAMVNSAILDDKRNTRVSSRSVNQFPLDEFDDDLDESLKLYRNLALSRLVKRAMESPLGAYRTQDGYLSTRSGSRAPELSALWKTRVG